MPHTSKRSLFSGAIITVSMRWVDRLIGVISTLLLARILVPDDFGIVAMASLIVSFTNIIFDLGINVALIQRKDPTPEYYNTAWTLRILQASVVALGLSLAAPFAADYYNEPRVVDVVRIMSLTIIIGAFENVGVINFQKSLDFVSDAKFILFKRMVGFTATIVLTLLLQSYWGMILGALSGRLIGTLRSYWIHPMRPQFCLKELGDIFSISQWVLVKNISQYIDRSSHIFIVGGLGQTSVTGGYTLAAEISDMPGTDLLAPINRVLFPAFAQAKENLKELTRLLMAAQGIQVMITVPACVGFVMTAHEFVPVALGEKWMFIIPFIQVLALSNIIQSISSSANYVLTVIGQIRVLAISSWVQIILFAAGIFSFWQSLTPELVAQVRLGSVIGTFGISYYMLKRFIPEVSISLMLKGIVRPIVGSAALVGVLYWIGIMLTLPPAMMLAVKVTAGVVTYTVVVLAMWWLAGRPNGAEFFFLNKLRLIPVRSPSQMKLK